MPTEVDLPPKCKESRRRQGAQPHGSAQFERYVLAVNSQFFFRTILSVVLSSAALQATAQNQLQVVLAGSSATTDASGRIVSHALNNQTILQDFAQANGLTDTSSLALAYHLHGSDLGDTIEVINRTNGASLYTVFGFYFGEDTTLGRAGLLSSSGRQMRRIEYIYTDQNSHSMGSAYLVNYFYFDTNGNTNKTYVFGNMQWVVLPKANQPNVQVCTANLTTYKPWTFPGQ